MRRRFILTALLLLGTCAVAQDCVDWSTTMAPPLEYSDVEVGPLVKAGEYLVSYRGQKVSVMRVDSDLEVMRLGEVSAPSYWDPLRVIGDEVFVCTTEQGLARLNLWNPMIPSLTTVFDPGDQIHDAAAVDGGFVVATAETLYVIDRLDGVHPQILSRLAARTDGIATHGAYVYFGGDVLNVVDLTDIKAPTLSSGDFYYPGDQIYNVQTTLGNLVVAGGSLYVSAYYYLGSHDSDSYLFRYDLSDPGSPDLVWEQSGIASSLVVMDDHLVAESFGQLSFFSLDGDQPEGRVYVGSGIGRSVGDGERLWIGGWFPAPLRRLECGHVEVVDPVATLPTLYDPAGCRRYGCSTHAVYWYDFDESDLDSAGWTVYDQLQPTAPRAIASRLDNVQTGEYLDCRVKVHLADQSDAWVALVFTLDFTYEDWTGGYSETDLEVIHAADGQVATISVDRPLARLDGDVLWVAESRPYLNDVLSTYRLVPGGCQLLDTVELPGSYCRRLDLDGDVFLTLDDQILVYDRDAPESLTVLSQGSLASISSLQTGGRIADGMLSCLTSTRELAIIDLDPDGSEIPAVVSTTPLTYLDGASLTWQGDLAMVHGRNGYQVVDCSDPGSPILLTGLVPVMARGAFWSGNHLYACGSSRTYLYDVDDLSAPVFVGQAAGGIDAEAPCDLGGALMVGDQVLPVDCGTPTPIDESDDPAPPASNLPGAATLLPAVPNPFNPTTRITFELAVASRVDLRIFDLRGRNLGTLLSCDCEPGRHHVTWNGQDAAGRALPSGTYLVQLRTETDLRCRKLMLVR